MEIVGFIMRAISFARCVGVGLDISKLGFVCGMLLWVQDSSTTWVQTSRGQGSIPLEEIMFMCVCLSLSYTLKCIAKCCPCIQAGCKIVHTAIH